MMRAFRTIVIVIMGLGLLSPGVTLAEQQLRGKVFVLGEHDERTPATNVPVGLDETGDSDITTDSGAFRIFLPDLFRPGDRVTLWTQMEGYQILTPPAGQTRVPAEVAKEIVTVELDVLGSHRFMSREAFTLLIEKMAAESKEQVAASPERVEIDLSRYLKEWALKYGFGLADVQAELDQWKAEVQAHSDDFYELGLAAFYAKHFSQAAAHFQQSAAYHAGQLAELRAQETDLREKVIRDYRMTGDALVNDYRFAEAVDAYKRALAETDRDTDQQRWGAILLDLSNAYVSLGIRAEGPAAQEYLTRAVDGYRARLDVFTVDAFPEEWATTQNNLGNALSNQGTRTGGVAGAALLAEAGAAYRAALTIRTRETLPQRWATTQNNLGNVLSVQGLHASGETGTALLAEAVTAFRAALTVYTRETLPQDWAMTQNNLGNALYNQGIRADGATGTTMLVEAMAAFRAALTVYTRENLPQDWAATQNNLGNALQAQGIRTGGVAGSALLAEVVDIYRASLTVYTRETLPQDWAKTQNNLGIALSEQGIRTGGEAGACLLAEAVDTFRASLTVYTRDTLPQDWAMTQNNLGAALSQQGIRTGGEAGTALLAEAVVAYRAALTVYTRETLPQDWAMTQNNLGAALKAQALLTNGDRRAQLLAEAIEALTLALEVRTFQYLPFDWAITHNNLAEGYIALEDWPNVADSCRNVLRVYPDYEIAYNCVSWIYHEVLFQFEDAFRLDKDWVTGRGHNDLSSLSNFAEKHVTTARFAAAEQRLAALFAELGEEHETAIRLHAIEIVSLLGQEKAEAVPAAFDALLAALQQQPEDFIVQWNFGGMKHFIETYAGLTPHRDWLLTLFAALEGENRDAILAQLQAARAAWPEQE